MAIEEKSFPRGGAVQDGKSISSKKGNLFEKTQKKKGSKTKKKVKHHVVTGAEPKLQSLEDLSYRVLTEGMVVLGCITEITDYYLHVSLPGLISGRVPVTQISDPYSQLLQSTSQSDDSIEALCPLSELFYKGQLVSAHIWQIRKSEDNRHVVTLSLDPKVVHSAWSHTAMAKEGLIITAAVKSKEEHGYVMDCGVNGLRSFLRNDKAQNYCSTFNGGRLLAIGQLVRCLVTKATTSSNASSIELSADPDDLSQQEEIGHPSVDMQHILPGMRFKLSVAEPMRDGVKAKFHNLSGYIHRNHIAKTASLEDSSLSQLEPGSVMFGRVVYVRPILKHIYFSALPNIGHVQNEIPKPSSAEINFKVGDRVDKAEVIGVGTKGVYLQFGKNKSKTLGFVPERRVGFNYKGKLEDNDDESTMLQRLRIKFPLGSSVRCRLLHYDCMSDTYVCSMEKSVLNEKYFSIADVHIGDTVPCIVEDIRNGGILVKIGMLNGFVPATHSADVPLHQPAKKFQPGSRVSGRVLKVDIEKHRLIVTLKQSLVNYQEPIITSYLSARKGISYSGTVVAISQNGVYVSFFGDVRGLIENNQNYVPEGHKFFLGQLIKCYVIRRNDKQIRLSMLLPNEIKHDRVACKTVHVGQMYNLEVVSIATDCLKVKVIDEGESLNASGVIPVLHLSDSPETSRLLFDTFETGTKLTNVWCFSSRGKNNSIVFSMRASVIQFFKSTQGKIANKKTLEAVCPGWVLPCSIQKVDSHHLYLDVPLASVVGPVKVVHENLCEKDENILSLGLVEGQGIQAKVLKVLADKNSLVLGCKSHQLWDGELETCVMQLSKHLSDQQRILDHAKKMGNPIGQLCVGKEVTGVVSEKTEWGYVFKLCNGARGEATFFNTQGKNLTIGTQVKGKVLHIDCLRDHVHMTLRKEICSTLNDQTQFDNQLSIDSDVQLRGPTLLVTPEFILVQLKGAGKHNFGYIPTFLYPFAPSGLTITEPFFGIDRKVIVKRCSNGIVICLPKEVIVQQKKESKRKSKLEERKLKKKERYYRKNLDKDAVKEEDEDSADESEEANRILDSCNDIQIIDEDMDDISDDESLSQAGIDSESDAEPLLAEIDLKSDEEKENKICSSKATKRSSDGNGQGDIAPSSLKKLRKDDGCVESSKTKKKPGNSAIVFEETLDSSRSGKSSKIKRKNESIDPEDDSVKEEETGKKRKKRSESKGGELEDDELAVISSSGKGEVIANNLETKESKKKMKVKNNINFSDDTGNAMSKQPVNPDKLDGAEKLTLKNPGFLWDIDPTTFMQVVDPKRHEVSSDDERESDDEKSKKKKRKSSAAERKEAARLEEERLQQVEKELLDPNRQLTSCDDFDKMVLANPDSSAVWLRYMAFHMEATEVEKARAVAQRAIKSISYREEQEKLNVWLGLLNLENLYGTSESLKTVLDQALQSNDPYKIRVHMVRMYAESGKNKELDSEVRLVVKKFKETTGMWQEIGSILMNNGHAEKARNLLQQALPHLKSKKDSISLVVQFALMEARNNNVEQAKALMDPILVSYPQRVDVWCTYCDLLVKANQISEARDLLERSVGQKLPARKMKTLFTKFMQFEEAHGSKEGQDRVRSMASDYVQQIAGDESAD